MYRYGLKIDIIAWILEIPRKDVKRAIREANAFDERGSLNSTSYISYEDFKKGETL